MDPLTLVVVGLAPFAVILLILAIRDYARPNLVSIVGTHEPDQVQPGSMRELLVRIKTDELLVQRVLSIVGVPLLMVVFSVALPALRNPLFLLVGAFAGAFLPELWLNGSRFGRIALVAGLVLAAVAFVLVAVLRT